MPRSASCSPTAALPERLREPLERIQNDLFDVGADLSVPFGIGDRLRVDQPHVERLEQLCDEFNAELPPLKSFVLPGGTPAAARLHVARTTCRRAERDALTADGGERDQPARARLPEPALGLPLHRGTLGERRRGPRRTALETRGLALLLHRRLRQPLDDLRERRGRRRARQHDRGAGLQRPSHGARAGRERDDLHRREDGVQVAHDADRRTRRRRRRPRARRDCGSPPRRTSARPRSRPSASACRASR